MNSISDLKVGDKVKIVDTRAFCFNSKGKMDYLLGEVFVLEERKNGGYFYKAKDKIHTKSVTAELGYYELNDSCINWEATTKLNNKKQEETEMTKSNVVSGKVVELRNSARRLVVTGLPVKKGRIETIGKALLGADTFGNLESFNDDLTHNGSDRGNDIVKVYDVKKRRSFPKIMEDDNLTLVWTRETEAQAKAKKELDAIDKSIADLQARANTLRTIV